MLSFEHYVTVRESAMADKLAGHGLTGGLGMGASVAGDVAQMGKALAVALGEHKSRTISFLRGLNDPKINGVLDEMSAGELNRVKNIFHKASGLGDEENVLAPNTADSHSGELP